MKRTIYNIYSPIGKCVKTCSNFKQAKKVLNKYNFNVSTQDYSNYYTMNAEVVYTNS